MQRSTTLRIITAAGCCMAILGAQIAFADSSGTLLPVADGAFAQWTPKSGTTHYTMVDESTCNGTTDYNRTTTVGKRDTYGVSLSAIPDGATITQIDITPCASRDKTGGGSSTLKVFYRFTGTNSADYGNYALTGTTPVALSTTSITGLSHVKGASSTLEIGAVYSAGAKGARLSRIAAVVTYTPLAAPSGLFATTASASQIDLSWTDGSSNENGFKIERSADGGVFAEIATTGSNTALFSDTTVSANHEYSYRVRAFNSGGNSAYSNTASAHTYTVPAAPSDLAVTSSGVSLRLTWTDNADNEDEFSVERKSGTGSFTQIATRPEDVTTFTDVTVQIGTTYTYRVRASNLAGYSAYSNEASGTP